jgi:hypothetical protein
MRSARLEPRHPARLGWSSILRVLGGIYGTYLPARASPRALPAAPLPALKPEREEGGRIPPEVLRRVAAIRRRIRELEEEERRLLAPYTGA